MTRPTCPRCLRPEASEEDWRTIPEGEDGPVPLCWGRGERTCEDDREDMIRTLLPALRAWREVPERARAWLFAAAADRLDEQANDDEGAAARAALTLLRVAAGEP